jgi:shikimate dehydrogenase
MTIEVCVIGWPISHSRSPLIHGYWLRRYGIDGAYGIEAIPPEALGDFLRNLGCGRYAGCNITIPHKEAAFPHVLIADAATRRLGAINTVYRRNGATWGTNTDGEGFLANVASCLPGWHAAGRRAVLLGAGGAARAVAGALIDAGASSVAVVNRTESRATGLRESFGATVEAHSWTSLPVVLKRADILINATSLGMKGQPPLEIDLSSLPQAAVVADLVYVPLETALIRVARAAGNPVVPGLGMLLHQAVRGFELWFGSRPEVTVELQALVAADIEAAT